MQKPAPKLRIAVLLSGNGTSLENLFEHIDAGLPAEVVCVLSSKKNAFGLARAEKRGIPTRAIPRREHRDVGVFNDALHEALEAFARLRQELNKRFPTADPSLLEELFR